MKKNIIGIFCLSLMVHSAIDAFSLETKSKKTALLKTIGGVILTAASTSLSGVCAAMTITDRHDIYAYFSAAKDDKPTAECLLAPALLPVAVPLIYAGYRLTKSGIKDLREIVQSEKQKNKSFN